MVDAGWESLRADDGHEFQAWVATPEGEPHGAVVVAQEIFGVNGHIRSVTEGFAEEGWLAIAPALFDRIRPGIELGYQDADIEEGRALMGNATPENALRDIAASVMRAGAAGRVGIVGYCWGGALAWMASQKVAGLSAASVYYGGRVPTMTDIQPACATILNFGDQDHGIPIDDVRAMQAERPTLPIHIYEAGHGFNCDERGSYDASAASQARTRTVGLFRACLG